MTLTEEVTAFAREYINKPRTRTADRKSKIREAIYVLTGENVVISCGTCYIEALFKILNITKMATSKYELKKGVVLQVFGDASKTCTNATITDAIGDWYMKNHPEKMVYFARYPKAEPAPVIPEKVIFPPIAPPVVVPEKVIPAEVDKVIADAMPTPAKAPAKAPAKKKTANAKK